LYTTSSFYLKIPNLNMNLNFDPHPSLPPSREKEL
jgi:hypothetical protein